MKPFQILSILLLLVFTLVCAVPASADNLYASIKGTATDQTGAVVAGVRLTATNTATGISFTETSSKDGNFSFLQLPIGDYKLKAEQTGFKAYQVSGIHLDLDQVYNLAVKLSIGAVSEQIVVEANPVQVEQTDMQLGTTISGQTIADMPLNGRDWTQLQQLEPGVVGQSDRFGGLMEGGYSGNGAETQQNSFLINGNDSNDAALNIALVIPSPDAIGEFRMVTSTLNPEYGRNSGSIVNAAIKNGTNAFHGDGFEFYRDTFMDAGAWFEPAPSPFHQNEFGGTIGGPIVKNHAFFFFSYQGRYFKEPDSGAVTSVPVGSSDEQGGVFAATTFNGTPGAASNGGPINPNLSPVAMYGDANSTCPVSGGVMCPAGTPYGMFYSPSNALITNGLFSTGTIPLGTGAAPIDGNPLAFKLMSQFVPAPNSGDNYNFSPDSIGHDDQFLGRLDYNLGQNDKLWFYGFWETNPRTDTIPFVGASLPGFAEDQQAHTQQYAVSWSHTFSPTTLNEFRLGYTRFNFEAVEPVNPINPTSYGFTGINPQNTALASLPVVNLAGFFSLGFSSDGPQPRIQNNYEIADNFSKVWGHHTFKFGISFERIELDNPFYANLSGTYTFDGGGAYSTSNPLADFLLGTPDSYAQGSGSIIAAKGYEYYAYAQDQWQVRPNLTITYGTGYDLEKPWVNAYGKGHIMAAFREGQQSTVFPFMPPGFVYPGDSGINQYGGMTPHYDEFGPRVGFAYSPGSNKNWSIHGGVGLYFNRTEEELALQTLENAPFALSSSGATGGACGTPAFATPFVTVAPTVNPTCSLINPFPYAPPALGATSLPAGLPVSTFFPVGLGFNGEDPKFTAPRSTNFNLTVERQLDKSTILSVAYVGNIGRHEEGAYGLNYAGVSPGTNAAAAAYNGGTCQIGLGQLNSSACPQTPITIANQFTGGYTLGTPVPGATPLNLAVYGQGGIQATGYNSNYNSLQVTLNRHFSNGLQLLAAYTWSRYFDQTSSLENGAFNFPGINPFDPKSMYAPSGNDAPQRFVVSYTYTLPFFKLTHRWKALTDDWNLSGVYTLQHGFPIPVFDLLGTSLTCDLFATFYACPDRAVRTSAPLGIGNPRNNPYTVGGVTNTNYWFNPAAFTIPASGTGIGSASRNPLYGPGINYGDMAIEKNIHIDESRYFQLRLETFNTFNHANFANPATPGFTNEDASGATGPTFGEIFSVRQISTNGDGRVLQLGAKFYF
jgi:hypothetical protein